MHTVISIDYVPGVCDSIIPYLYKKTCTVLPTHTDIVKDSSIKSGIVSCLHNILCRLQHIKRCTDTSEPIVCTHWYDIPFRVVDSPLEDVVVRFLERHTKSLIQAFGIQYRHFPVVLEIQEDECLERMITNMNGREIGIHHIKEYTKHLKKIPGTLLFTVPQDGLDIRYICERIVETILSNTHGF